MILQAHNCVSEFSGGAALVPCGTDGLSLDIVRRHPELENGVMELMIAELHAARLVDSTVGDGSR